MGKEITKEETLRHRADDRLLAIAYKKYIAAAEAWLAAQKRRKQNAKVN